MSKLDGIDTAGRQIAGLLGYNPGPGIYSRLEQSVEAAHKNVGSARLRAMLAARRSMIDASPGVRSGMPLVTPRGGDWSAAVEAEPYIDHVVGELAGGGIRGGFSPSGGRYPGVGIVAYPRDDWATRRHEVMHGYTEAARQGYPGMPAASRLAARLPKFLGVPLDEMAATRAGGGSVIAKNWPWYALHYARHGEYGPAAAYAGLAAAQAGGALGAGVGAGLLLGAGAAPAPGEAAPEEDPVDYLRSDEMRRRLIEQGVGASLLAPLLMQDGE